MVPLCDWASLLDFILESFYQSLIWLFRAIQLIGGLVSVIGGLIAIIVGWSIFRQRIYEFLYSHSGWKNLGDGVWKKDGEAYYFDIDKSKKPPAKVFYKWIDVNKDFPEGMILEAEVASTAPYRFGMGVSWTEPEYVSSDPNIVMLEMDREALKPPRPAAPEVRHRPPQLEGFKIVWQIPCGTRNHPRSKWHPKWLEPKGLKKGVKYHLKLELEKKDNEIVAIPTVRKKNFAEKLSDRIDNIAKKYDKIRYVHFGVWIDLHIDDAPERTAYSIYHFKVYPSGEEKPKLVFPTSIVSILKNPFCHSKTFGEKPKHVQ